MNIPNFVKKYKELESVKREMVKSNFNNYLGFLKRAMDFYDNESKNPKHSDPKKQYEYLAEFARQVSLHLNRVKSTYEDICAIEDLLQSTLEMSLGDFLIKFNVLDGSNVAGDSFSGVRAILTDEILGSEYSEITLEELSCWSQIQRFLKGRFDPKNIEVVNKSNKKEV